MRSPSQQEGALADLRLQVEQRLAALLPPHHGPAAGVAAAMHAAVLGAGKRLRPLLLLGVGRALGCHAPALLDLACAVEFVHCASLVLDDMPAMDDARLRRGQPTLHLRFGEDVAMLSAVALVSEACRVAASAPGLPPAARADIVQALCEAIGPGGLVRGQYRDLRESAAARSVGAIATTNDEKTGVLFACAAGMAARAAGRGDAVPALRRAGFALGQAFQLRDDLEDQPPPGAAAAPATMVQLVGTAAVEAAIRAQLVRTLDALQEARVGDDPLLLGLLQRTFAEHWPVRPASVHVPLWPRAGSGRRPLPAAP